MNVNLPTIEDALKRIPGRFYRLPVLGSLKYEIAHVLGIIDAQGVCMALIDREDLLASYVIMGHIQDQHTTDAGSMI